MNDIDQFAENLIRNDVLCCDSALVDELLRRDIITIDEVENLSADIEDLTWDVWIVGSNLPGCLPDSDPAVFATHKEAVAQFVDVLERESEDDNPDGVFSERWEAIQKQRDDAIATASVETGEFTCQIGDYVAWLARWNMTTAQLRDAIGASSRWWDPFDDGFHCADGFECMDDLQREPLEWWRVSRSLLRELRDIGEVVIDSEYGEWWGRCTSGQTISLDGVFQRIAQRINSRIGG